MNGWTAESLKQREDLERDQFGTGRLEPRVDKDRLGAEEEMQRRATVAAGEGSSTGLHRARRLRDKFVGSSALMAHAISMWLDDFMSIPLELIDDGCIRVGRQIGRKLLGIPDDDEVRDDEITTTLTQAREDEEEYSQEWIDEMEKMMAAYDKKKSITKSFTRPSFVLDGFECPDPFPTQPTPEACVSAGGVQPPKPDGQASVAPDVDRPVNEDCQGGAAMSDPLCDVAGLGVPADVRTSVAATHMEVVGGETGGIGETVNERREITEGGTAKVGSSGDESRGVRGGKEVVIATKQKSVKVIKDMSWSDGRVKGGFNLK